CGRFPPEVRTAIPVEGRFEHIVLSCNTTSDHALLWIEREAQKALQEMMGESSETTTAPSQQKMERKQTMQKEHRDALQRALTLQVPHAVSLSETDEGEEGKAEIDSANSEFSENQHKESINDDSRSGERTNWDYLVSKLFTHNETGNLVLKKDIGSVEGK
ncbi:hypothetical protein HPP92_026380, partial [Vanilla planifolia]